MSTTSESGTAPFERLREEILEALLRPELEWREIPSPDRIAPRSLALAAAIKQGSRRSNAFDSPTGSGRFILLNDPASSTEWDGEYRIVCYAQSPLEVEIGMDPFIADVTWTWLLDALERHEAPYTNIAGTATKIISQGFGTLDDQGRGSQLELRASWTPDPGAIVPHVQAWAEVLCSLAGFPYQEGAASLDAHRAAKARDHH